jgi:hypothetical protein
MHRSSRHEACTPAVLGPDMWAVIDCRVLVDGKEVHSSAVIRVIRMRNAWREENLALCRQGEYGQVLLVVAV